MEQDILRKLQLTQLEIAKEIRRVCEENDIRYFLCCGSFLGAVRHQGFIPWDDDFDIGMLREDYERFCRIAPEKLKPEYCLQSWHTDSRYALPFAKVRKRGTLLLERKSIHLDENGSFVWPLIDGEKNIIELGKDVKEHFGEKADTLSDRLLLYSEHLAIANFGGFPSITIPSGLVENMPVAVNITCPVMKDDVVFNIANKLEEKIGFTTLSLKEEK